MTGRWTFTCAGDAHVPGCGRHEHHSSPQGADLAARLHQAEHAVRNGASHRDVPKRDDDPAWGPFCRLWKAPVVAMDAGTLRQGCAACHALRGMPPPKATEPAPKAGPDFY